MVKGMSVRANTPNPRRKRRSVVRTAGLIQRVRDLRRMETGAEEEAWGLLRSLRLKGFKFRRQHPLSHYIVDFCCPARRLIVELDGSVHGLPSQIKRDAHRDAQLRNLGYIVARYPNAIVLQAPELFVEKVLTLVWSLPEAFEDKS